MEASLLRKLVDRNRPAPQPGDSSFLSKPNGGGAIEAAVVHHHRSAFFYWLKWATSDWQKSLVKDNLPCDLVTVDFHDDVGGSCDCIFNELDTLIGELEVGDVSVEAELERVSSSRRDAERSVAAYTFLGLRALNDGHIYPAQYLNAIQNVYVLYKQREPNENSFKDRFGNEHHIRYFNDPEKLVQALDVNDSSGTYFDLDVDYFFEEGDGRVHGNEVLVPEADIREMMDPRSEFMAAVLSRNLEGMTFAIEPTYCGGLGSCFEAMSIVMDSLFDGRLLGGSEIRWN